MGQALTSGKHYAIQDEPPPANTDHLKRRFLDVPCASLSGAHKLDICLPDGGEGPFPAIVYIHGGAFMAGDKADALRRFLASMRDSIGEGVYDSNTIHFGAHPQAKVGSQQCPNLLCCRSIEHSHSSHIHVRIGAPKAVPETYPYWMHITGNIRTATLKVGDSLMHDRGYLTTLDDPVVRAIAAKYPARPGLEPAPRFQ